MLEGVTSLLAPMGRRLCRTRRVALYSKGVSRRYAFCCGVGIARVLGWFSDTLSIREKYITRCSEFHFPHLIGTTAQRISPVRPWGVSSSRPKL